MKKEKRRYKETILKSLEKRTNQNVENVFIFKE